jgi:hypothetical protein
MAAENWKDNLTEADWSNWRYAHQQFLDREAELCWEAPMAEAAVSLSPNRETQRMLRHRSAVMTLARMRAKK